MIEAGAVVRINVSEHEGNTGRICDVMGKVGRHWIVCDGLPFDGYAPGGTRDNPTYTTQMALGIEAWKLQRVY
jgi:hypothetical protein